MRSTGVLLHGLGSSAEWGDPCFEPFVLTAGCRYEYLDPTVNKGWDIAGESIITCEASEVC
jgi:hypothetical protein